MTDKFDPKQAIFQDALATSAATNYLGDWETVEGLVRVFVQNVLQAESEQALYDECNRMALVFSGVEQDYTVVPEWHSRDGLGLKACETLGIDPDQSYQDILRAAFADYATQLLELVKTHHDQPQDTWDWQIDALVEEITALLVGLIDTLYPGEDEDTAA